MGKLPEAVHLWRAGREVKVSGTMGVAFSYAEVGNIGAMQKSRGFCARTQDVFVWESKRYFHSSGKSTQEGYRAELVRGCNLSGSQETGLESCI